MSEEIVHYLTFMTLIILAAYYLYRIISGDMTIVNTQSIRTTIYIVDGRQYMRIINKVTYASGRFKYKTDIVEL